VFNQAEQMQRVCMIRIQFNDFPINGFGFVYLAFLMTLNSDLKRVVDVKRGLTCRDLAFNGCGSRTFLRFRGF